MSHHGWASANPFQFYLIFLLYLCFNKKHVRVINNNYIRQSFLPFKKFLKRILCYIICLVPILLNFLIIILFSQTLVTYIVTIPFFIVQGLIFIYVHVWLMKLLKC